jgi:hypothetical protein
VLRIVNSLVAIPLQTNHIVIVIVIVMKIRGEAGGEGDCYENKGRGWRRGRFARLEEKIRGEVTKIRGEAGGEGDLPGWRRK